MFDELIEKLYWCTDPEEAMLLTISCRDELIRLNADNIRMKREIDNIRAENQRLSQIANY
jgi:hypothetical protein